MPGRRAGAKSWGGFLGGVAVLLVYWFIQTGSWPWSPRPSTNRPTGGTSVERPVPTDAGDDAAASILNDGGIGKLYREKRSDVMVEAGGTVARVLPDDNETSDGSSRHQRFIVRLPTGDTVLVAHNIDLAPRVPLKEGDPIRFRGEYEWTERGGVVHWTHADPRNRRADGWVRHAGQTYR